MNQRKHASCVRLTSKEYLQLEEDSISTGQSIPELLREKYFKGPRLLPLMAKPDVAQVTREFGQICNSLSEMNRRWNSGIRFGFVEELTTIQTTFDSIWSFLVSRYCRCKPHFAK